MMKKPNNYKDKQILKLEVRWEMAIKKALHVTIPWLQVLNKFLKKCSQTMGAITKGLQQKCCNYI